MVTTVIAATLAATTYSLWVRRGSWWSRWEAGANLTVLLLGCAVLLMSPWASENVGPPLYRALDRWNVEDLLGHFCLVGAVIAVIYHSSVRLRDDNRITRLFRRHVATPVWLGVPLMVAIFVVADEDYHRDLFRAPLQGGWLTLYWLVALGLLSYLLTYEARVLWILRADPRSKTTVDLYLIAVACCVAANAIQVGTAWAGADVTLPVWVCACLGAAVFSLAAARSWQARIGWFIPGQTPPPPQPIPPRSVPTVD